MITPVPSTVVEAGVKSEGGKDRDRSTGTMYTVKGVDCAFGLVDKTRLTRRWQTLMAALPSVLDHP
jgi:hypothetical protein